jgi:putative ABC transport system substrate-binding protein
MRRRQVLELLAAGLAGAALPAKAQKPVPVLGILNPNAPVPTPGAKPPSPILAERLRKLGWVEGENLRIERASGGGSDDQLEELAAGLVRKRVDVIYAFGQEAAIAAARATKSIPIVFWGSTVAVEVGLVNALNRPGRNVTGVAFSPGVEIAQKRLELLREIVPAATRVALITQPVRTIAGTYLTPEVVNSGQDAAARALSVELRRYPVERKEDFGPTLKSIGAARPQAMMVGATMLTLRERPQLIEFANRNRIPAMYGGPEWVAAGGLVAYGVDSNETTLQALAYVDRVLRGANPAELPVIFPSRYVLAVNLKTARANGVTMPKSVLLRADRVIG